MKSLFKTTLLVTTLSMVLNTSQVFAADANKKFDNEDQRSAYALGASLGRYMDNSLMQQKSIGINLDRQQLLAGVQDAFVNKSKLSDQEIETTLKAFEEKVRAAAQAKMEEESKKNGKLGDEYRAKYLKEEKSAIKTKSGLIYKIEKPGEGAKPTDKDTVVVNYEGRLIDGSVFDSSYKRNEPLTIALDSVIPGWTEGLQQLKKGGKIQLIIPPELGYGKSAAAAIPANSTLIFNVELLDIKPTNK
ncbi:MAG TPA: FKBP-type peptidyl-prolyl cis-trans isomerase [Arsenophonus apicola]|jgi:FKBP-type peptidyl-prolyl cis-trans isomerase FkpA|uniref:FKBP-type peptidyl-prolyl cis-trans isomerase n=1 Tax=Arsenophonus apicola TaxID=2879119 RepID=UPI0038799C3F